MKNSKFAVLVLLFSTISSFDSLAQTSMYIDVNGVAIGLQMTSGQVIEVFGEPDRHVVSDDGSLVGLDETYHYGANSVSFMNNRLYGFSVYNEEWAVLTESFPGGLRVGTLKSVVEEDDRFVLQVYPGMEYHYYILDASQQDSPDDSSILLRIECNVISGITYMLNYW